MFDVWFYKTTLMAISTWHICQPQLGRLAYKWNGNGKLVNVSVCFSKILLLLKSCFLTAKVLKKSKQTVIYRLAKPLYIKTQSACLPGGDKTVKHFAVKYNGNKCDILAVHGPK